jgi:hypothetical protein
MSTKYYLPLSEKIIWFGSLMKNRNNQAKKIDQSLEWIAAGKGRFWQYEK